MPAYPAGMHARIIIRSYLRQHHEIDSLLCMLIHRVYLIDVQIYDAVMDITGYNDSCIRACYRVDDVR